LIPWLNQALGIPQERVQHTTPSTLEELERTDTAGARPKSPPLTTSSRARSRDLVAAAAENRPSIPILKGLTTPIPALFPEVDTAAAPPRVADDDEPPSGWRVVLALVEAHRGAAERARQLVEDARKRMASAESGMQADALLESAEALRAAGLDDEAAALVAEAAGIAQRPGYVVARRRAEKAQRALTA
jgi:hypothetical protein